MPGNALAPRCAFLSRVDARPWDNTQVMSIDGNAVTLPNYADGEGVFEDALHFLNGMGSRDDDIAGISGRTLAFLIQNGWTGGATVFTAGINASDRIWVESSLLDFAIDAQADNPLLGFPAGGTGNVGGAAPFRHTATTDWTRGNLTDLVFTVNPAGAGATYNITVSRVQSAVTLVRNQNQNDADETNNTGNLERRIQTALTLYTVRVGIDDTGHVYMAWPTGAVAIVTWSSTSFRDRLGYSGSEAITASGGVDLLVAAYQMPGVWVPTRPLRRLIQWADERTATEALTSGGVAANHISRWTGWRAELWAGGQVDATDEEYHVLRQFWNYVPVGYPLSLYHQWGDSRRQLYAHQVTSTVAAYGLLYTSERRRGRLRCLRDPTDETRREQEYETGLLLRAPMTIVIRDRVD